MKQFRDWARTHEVISFFVGTCLITEVLGFSYWSVMREGRFLLAPLMFAATCGPALAGIFVALLTRLPFNVKRPRGIWTSLLLAWIIVSAVFLAHFTFINNGTLSPDAVSLAIMFFFFMGIVIVADKMWRRLPETHSVVCHERAR